VEKTQCVAYWSKGGDSESYRGDEVQLQAGVIKLMKTVSTLHAQSLTLLHKKGLVLHKNVDISCHSTKISRTKILMQLLFGNFLSVRTRFCPVSETAHFKQKDAFPTGSISKDSELTTCHRPRAKIYDGEILATFQGFSPNYLFSFKGGEP
jgi:hypothetical protein